MTPKSWRRAAAAAGLASSLFALNAATGGVDEPDAFPGAPIGGTPDGVLIAADLEDRGCADIPGCARPDTLLGVYDDLGGVAETDDDSSTLGNGRASGIFGRAIEPSGLIEWAVSGAGDLDFDGQLDADPATPHGQTGGWEGYIRYFGPDSNFLGEAFIGFHEFVNGDEVFTGTVNARAEAATYDLVLDNSVTFCGCVADVDFFAVSGLTPDAEYVIRPEAGFDAVLGVFDSAGTLLEALPAGGGSLRVTADGDGVLHLALTGDPDDAFAGRHRASGGYEIEIAPPEPCNLADLAKDFGELDLADIVAFLEAFNANDPAVDYDGDQEWDLDDLVTFVTAFTAGCP